MAPEMNEVKNWLEKADHDRVTAEAALDHHPPIADTAAFHCQQAAEKLLKAYLVCRGVEFEKTHDLRVLLLRCADFDPAFSTLFDQVVPLTAYAVRFRYPGPAEPSAEQVREALGVVNELCRFVKARLPSMEEPVYQDDQCWYHGGDPRELAHSGLARVALTPNAVIINVSRATEAEKNGKLVEESLHFPRGNIIGIAGASHSMMDLSGLGPEVVGDIELSKEFQESFAPGVTIKVRDPEGVDEHGFDIALTFRNDYYARVFEKRVREAFRL